MMCLFRQKKKWKFSKKSNSYVFYYFVMKLSKDFKNHCRNIFKNFNYVFYHFMIKCCEDCKNHCPKISKNFNPYVSLCVGGVCGWVGVGGVHVGCGCGWMGVCGGWVGGCSCVCVCGGVWVCGCVCVCDGKLRISKIIVENFSMFMYFLNSWWNAVRISKIIIEKLKKLNFDVFSMWWNDVRISKIIVEKVELILLFCDEMIWGFQNSLSKNFEKFESYMFYFFFFLMKSCEDFKSHCW